MTPAPSTRRRGYARKRLMTVAIAAFSVIGSLVWRGPTLMLWNASASVPIGLYLVSPGATLHVGDLAILELPANVRDLAARRQYLPHKVLLIKPVAATPGMTVCRYGEQISIDGRIAGEAKDTDSHRRPLPSWQGCHLLAPDELFVMNPQVADSFDGRYFGPASLSLSHGRAWPILTFRSQPHF